MNRPETLPTGHESIPLVLLRRLYGTEGEVMAERILAHLDAVRSRVRTPLSATPVFWSEHDVVLITYANTLNEPGTAPLQTLHQFLRSELQGVVNTIHVLPFFPFSSDDGFAVIDYYSVDPEVGSWEDLQGLAGDFRLMVDLVINHVSRESLWFMDFINDALPGRDYFLVADPNTDLSAVIRPRTSPLLVPIHTYRGMRHLWATFSEDQIDLNFARPEVLLAMLHVLDFYLQQGARVIRLDAIAYLWKEVGTACIHHPRTHDVVRLLRWYVERICDPQRDPVTLITETNVPHDENVTYFGQGDEAHMVYQFTLAPLLLHALLSGDSDRLTAWGRSLAPPPPGCTFLNFTASHDGIGLRPAEGWLTQNEISAMVDLVHQFGGFVSKRALKEGTDQPYELNVALFDALQGTFSGRDNWQVERFLCSQVIMLSLQGVPAIYLHSLLATGNDLERVERTGRTRSINRSQWSMDALMQQLSDHRTPHARVFDQYRQLLVCRRRLPAFAPQSPQRFLAFGRQLLSLQRGIGVEALLILVNVSNRPAAIDAGSLAAAGWGASSHDQIDGAAWDLREGIRLAPYQALWLQRD